MSFLPSPKNLVAECIGNHCWGIAMYPKDGLTFGQFRKAIFSSDCLHYLLPGEINEHYDKLRRELKPRNKEMRKHEGDPLIRIIQECISMFDKFPKIMKNERARKIRFLCDDGNNQSIVSETDSGFYHIYVS